MFGHGINLTKKHYLPNQLLHADNHPLGFGRNTALKNSTNQPNTMFAVPHCREGCEQDWTSKRGS